jgi:hypothetical protein
MQVFCIIDTYFFLEQTLASEEKNMMKLGDVSERNRMGRKVHEVTLPTSSSLLFLLSPISFKPKFGLNIF